MRLWSLHPRYLDAKGLVALWREGLLAKKVLSGETVGYTRHPQLERFKTSADPLVYIDIYLALVADEADARGYHFNREKLDPNGAQSDVIRALSPEGAISKLYVTSGQLEYEARLLAGKLERRDPSRLFSLSPPTSVEPHPLFTLIVGPIASWERVRDKAVKK